MSAINYRTLITTAIAFSGTIIVMSSVFPTLSTFALFALSVVLTPVAVILGIIIPAIVVTVVLLVASLFMKVNPIDSLLRWFANLSPKQ